MTEERDLRIEGRLTSIEVRLTHIEQNQQERKVTIRLLAVAAIGSIIAEFIRLGFTSGLASP